MSYSGPRNPRGADRPDGEAMIVIYNYIPSLALGVIGIIAFAIALLAHGYYAIRHKRTRTFEILLAFGSMMEIVGYGSRIRSHENPFIVNAFIIQYFFIVCAPVFFAAAFYLTLSQIARWSKTEQYLPIRPRLVVLIFVICDVITIAVQVGGAALVGVTESARANGETTSLTSDDANNILLAGLAAQCASFLTFMVILGLFMKRVRSYTSSRVRQGLWVLLGTSVLLFGRTIFRLAETAEGVWGYAFSHEYLFGIFEFAPVAIALLLWAALPLFSFIRDEALEPEMVEYK